MLSYIENWIGSSTSSNRAVTFNPLPPALIKDPGSTLRITSAAPSDFGTTVYPLLTQYCASCHRENAATPQSPYFASADLSVAFNAAQQKIDLNTPVNSRLVERMIEGHNCWDRDDTVAGDAPYTPMDNCAYEMYDAIRDLATTIVPTEVDSNWVTSKALRLQEGILATGGVRNESNVIALYEFRDPSQEIAYDTSGIEPQLNLNLSGDVVKLSGGLQFNGINGKAQGSSGGSSKLTSMIQLTGEYSIEAWVTPMDTAHRTPIVSYSGGNTNRNFMLEQYDATYSAFNRSANADGTNLTDSNGAPEVSSDAATLAASQQHVVITYDALNGRRIYVNGELANTAANTDDQLNGTLASWNNTYALVLGNEVTGTKPWAGTLQLVAIHNRALSEEQIVQNFDAGIGDKYYLSFNVDQHTGLTDSYIIFEAMQFDQYSYLFHKPIFAVLNDTQTPDNIRIRGMRIGVNGKLSDVGQAYSKLDTTITTDTYIEAGQVLSNVGTVISMDSGITSDEFFLVFDQLGTDTYQIVENTPTAPTATNTDEEAPVVGLRTFEEIHASMSVMTGVSMTNTNVANKFNIVKQQLPTVEGASGFLSAHQLAVTQLAIEYCNALVDDSTMRASYFSGFNFGAIASDAFNSDAKQDQIIDPLLKRSLSTDLAGNDLDFQADPTATRTELRGLMSRLVQQCVAPVPPAVSTCTANNAEHTAKIVKGTCAAAIGSAAMLLQ